MLSPTHDGRLARYVPYMSPEQARGKPVDKRTDIWAFACVLYEMLTGRRAFAGETTTDTVVAILEREPDWGVVSSDVPDAVVTTLKRCFEKDPKLRLRDIGDVRFDRLSEEPVQPRTRRHLLPWALAVLVAVSAVALRLAPVRGGNPPSERPGWAADGATFSIQAPTDHADAVVPQPQIAVSSDGRYIAWVGNLESGRPSIWLYTVSDGNTRELTGTAGAGNPFWSPDARAIGFQSQGVLRTMDVTTGAIRLLAPNPEVSAGGAWSPANVIVFSTRYTLQMIPSDRRRTACGCALNPNIRRTRCASRGSCRTGATFSMSREAGGPAEVPRMSARSTGQNRRDCFPWHLMSSMPRRAISSTCRTTSWSREPSTRPE